MDRLWLAVFIVSLAGFAFVLIQGRFRVRLLAVALMNATFAAVVIFLLGETGVLAPYTIPFNAFTVAVVGVLGLPGVGLLVGIKWLVH